MSNWHVLNDILWRKNFNQPWFRFIMLMKRTLIITSIPKTGKFTNLLKSLCSSFSLLQMFLKTFSSKNQIILYLITHANKNGRSISWETGNCDVDPLFWILNGISPSSLLQRCFTWKTKSITWNPNNEHGNSGRKNIENFQIHKCIFKRVNTYKLPRRKYTMKSSDWHFSLTGAHFHKHKFSWRKF